MTLEQLLFNADGSVTNFGLNLFLFGPLIFVSSRFFISLVLDLIWNKTDRLNLEGNKPKKTGEKIEKDYFY